MLFAVLSITMFPRMLASKVDEMGAYADLMNTDDLRDLEDAFREEHMCICKKVSSIRDKFIESYFVAFEADQKHPFPKGFALPWFTTTHLVSTVNRMDITDERQATLQISILNTDKLVRSACSDLIEELNTELTRCNLFHAGLIDVLDRRD